MSSYYTIGALPTRQLAAFAKKAEATIQRLKGKAESHIKAKAKEGAISATPTIRKEVRSEVTPYIAGAVGVSLVAILIAARKR